MIPSRGQILVSRTDDDTFPPLPVSVQNVTVCTGTTRTFLKHMCAWCLYTRGRFGRTHGGFQRATPHHTAHTPLHKTQHTRHQNNNTPQQHTETDIERQRKETETERGERREDERRKTREKIKDQRKVFVHKVSRPQIRRMN